MAAAYARVRNSSRSAAGDAWEEAAKHLLAFMNGHEIRGERFDGRSTYRDEVDRVFFQPRPAEGDREAVRA